MRCTQCSRSDGRQRQQAGSSRLWGGCSINPHKVVCCKDHMSWCVLLRHLARDSAFVMELDLHLHWQASCLPFLNCYTTSWPMHHQGLGPSPYPLIQKALHLLTATQDRTARIGQSSRLKKNIAHINVHFLMCYLADLSMHAHRPMECCGSMEIQRRLPYLLKIPNRGASVEPSADFSDVWAGRVSCPAFHLLPTMRRSTRDAVHICKKPRSHWG